MVRRPERILQEDGKCEKDGPRAVPVRGGPRRGSGAAEARLQVRAAGEHRGGRRLGDRCGLQDRGEVVQGSRSNYLVSFEDGGSSGQVPDRESGWLVMVCCSEGVRPGNITRKFYLGGSEGEGCGQVRIFW